MEEVASLHCSPAEVTTNKAHQKDQWLYLDGSIIGLVEFKNGKLKVGNNQIGRDV